MVEELMKNMQSNNTENNEVNDANDTVMEMAKYIYNIWDFSGHALYFLLHQVNMKYHHIEENNVFFTRISFQAFLTPHAVYILVFDVSEDLEAQLLLSPKDSTVVSYNNFPFTFPQSKSFY